MLLLLEFMICHSMCHKPCTSSCYKSSEVEKTTAGQLLQVLGILDPTMARLKQLCD